MICGRIKTYKVRSVNKKAKPNDLSFSTRSSSVNACPPRPGSGQLSDMSELNEHMIELTIEALTGTVYDLCVSPFETILGIKMKIQRLEG